MSFVKYLFIRYKHEMFFWCSGCYLLVMLLFLFLGVTGDQLALNIAFAMMSILITALIFLILLAVYEWFRQKYEEYKEQQ